MSWEGGERHSEALAPTPVILVPCLYIPYIRLVTPNSTQPYKYVPITASVARGTTVCTSKKSKNSSPISEVDKDRPESFTSDPPDHNPTNFRWVSFLCAFLVVLYSYILVLYRAPIA